MKVAKLTCLTLMASVLSIDGSALASPSAKDLMSEWSKPATRIVQDRNDPGVKRELDILTEDIRKQLERIPCKDETDTSVKAAVAAAVQKLLDSKIVAKFEYTITSQCKDNKRDVAFKVSSFTPPPGSGETADKIFTDWTTDVRTHIDQAKNETRQDLAVYIGKSFNALNERFAKLSCANDNDWKRIREAFYSAIAKQNLQLHASYDPRCKDGGLANNKITILDLSGDSADRKTGVAKDETDTSAASILVKLGDQLEAIKKNNDKPDIQTRAVESALMDAKGKLENITCNRKSQAEGLFNVVRSLKIPVSYTVDCIAGKVSVTLKAI